MRSKEYELRQDLGIAKESAFNIIRNEEGVITGIATSDASLDYSAKGQEFLKSGITKAAQVDSSHRLK